MEKNLIYWKPVSTMTRRLKVLVLTDKGKKSIPGVKIKKVFHKQGSWEHEYWKYMVGEHYRNRGYKVTFEYKIGEGKSVDVVAEKDGKRISIEVETGKSDAVYNVIKDMKAGFEKIICVALNPEVRDSTENKLKVLNLDGKIKVVQVDDFL